jgi:ankyrin repeat protein
MHLVDNYGNTPFHTAARSGSPECVEVLASHEEENLRQVLSGKIVVSTTGQELMGRPEAKPPVEGVASMLYKKMIGEKMKRSEAQRFLKDWCFETSQRVYDIVKSSEHKMIGPPTKEIMEHVLSR